MWLEMIVDGAVVTFSQAGMYLDQFGKDPRCEWASRIESDAQKTCGNKEGVKFGCEKGDLRIWLHRDAVRTVVRIIAEAEPAMPEEVRVFYRRISYLLQHSDELGVRVLEPR